MAGICTDCPSGCLLFQMSKLASEATAMPSEVKAEHALDKSFSEAKIRARRAFEFCREFGWVLGFTSRFEESAKNSSHKVAIFP